MLINMERLDRTTSLIAEQLPSFPKLITNEIKARGAAGFVVTFKKLKAWGIQLISGNREYKEDWFACLKYMGYNIPCRFKNVFQPLVRAILRDDRKAITWYLSVLNIYHVVDGPNPKDYHPMIKVAIQPAHNVSELDRSFYSALLRTTLVAVLVDYTPKGVTSLPVPTGQTVAIYPGEKGSFSQYIARGAPYSKLEEEIRSQANNPAMNYGPITDEEYIPSARKTPFMGNFALIGETGGKSRLILIGTPVLQTELAPLKAYLLRLLKEIPTDCTHNQEEGVAFLRKSLGHKKVHSIDLKDATWNFPLYLQEVVAKGIGVPKVVRNKMFRTLAYDSKANEFARIVKGQAMGLGPSFPLFSLTHNLLLAGLCRWFGVEPIDTFRILGDDVIITEDRVAKAYRLFLDRHGVPVSLSKTLSSSTTGEFAGRILHLSGNVTPIKWKRLSWESLRSLWRPYSRVMKRIPSTLNFGKGALISYKVLAPLNHKIGGLGIQDQKLIHTSNRRINNLRCGYIEEWIKGHQVVQLSFGKSKLPQLKLKLKTRVDELETETLRKLSRQLETDVISENYGLLPFLSPNPAKVFSQLGEAVSLMPIRERKSVIDTIPLRIKHAKSVDWKTLQNEALDLYREVSNDKKSKETPEKPKESIYRNFFGRVCES